MNKELGDTTQQIQVMPPVKTQSQPAIRRVYFRHVMAGVLILAGVFIASDPNRGIIGIFNLNGYVYATAMILGGLFIGWKDRGVLGFTIGTLPLMFYVTFLAISVLFRESGAPPITVAIYGGLWVVSLFVYSEMEMKD